MALTATLILVAFHAAPPADKPPEDLATPPTWHGDIQAIVHRKCLACHRDGGAGPFSLETCDEVSSRGRMITAVVESGFMPPWYAAPPPAGQESPWHNDRSLTRQERDLLLAWLASDRPVGDPTRAPVKPVFENEWSIGTPDLVLDIGKPVSVPAEGRMDYVYRQVDTGLEEDAWVTAWEVLPSDAAVVHHVLVFLVEDGSRRRPDETSGFFAAYVPGLGGATYQPGQAKRLPAGSTLLFQVHYTPNGKPVLDQTRVGIQLATGPPEQEVHTAGLFDRSLSIPPGAAAHEERASRTLPRDIHLLSIMPHMHLRGSAFRAEHEPADGPRRLLLEVPRYDFNWQIAYQFKDPPLIRRGDIVHITGVFNNSSANPANPDPDRRVRWGRQTHDEMLIGYVEYTVPRENRRQRNRPSR